MTTKRIMMMLCAGIAALAETLPPPHAKLPDSLSGVKDQEQVEWLDAMANRGGWSPAEAEMLPAEPVDGHPAFVFHVPVDHFGGEEKYPVGWPRTYFNNPASINWKDYDYFQFKIYAKSNRDAIPRRTVSLALRGVGSGNSYELALGKDNISLNEWKTITMPITRIEKFLPLRVVGFYVCESDFNHGDTLDFTIGGFKLVRASTIKITTLKCDGIRYDKTPVLNVSLTTEGAASKIGKGVPFALSDANGKVLRLETLPVVRGTQSIAMDVSELRLRPGDYKLTAFPDNPEKRLEVGFKIIDSPWEVGK